MSWSIGLAFGESFAEVAAARDDQIVTHRWFMPKLGLATGLESFMKLHSISEVGQFHVTTKLAQQILQRRIGTPPAFLTTSGFEDWLEMSLPLRDEHLTLAPQRRRSPLSRDLVFGINERINADGQVESALDESELEFLAAKLEMSEVTHVAIGFLHSNKNPEHENKTATYLRERGFNVFTSSQFPGNQNEKSRWWHAVLNAYIGPQFLEIMSEVTDYIEEKTGVQLNPQFSAYNGPISMADEQDFLPTIHGAASSLLSFLPEQRSRVDYVLYCGLEDLWLLPLKNEPISDWNSEFGIVALSSPSYYRLRLQPTQKLDKGFWGCARFMDTEVGYEPGPMCMGRGLGPALLDVLYLQDRLPAITGLSEQINEKTGRRVYENLIAISREAFHHENFSESEPVGWLEETATESWFMDIWNHTDGKGIHLCGPLAPVFNTLLKDYLPKMTLLKMADDLLARSMVLKPGEGVEE